MLQWKPMLYKSVPASVENAFCCFHLYMHLFCFNFRLLLDFETIYTPSLLMGNNTMIWWWSLG